MNSQVTAYCQPNKKKSQRLLEAFAAGCGGRMASTTARELELGPAAFYGMRESFAHLLKQAKAERRDWWVIDNSYFDVVRETQFRVTKNAMQHTGQGESDGKRFAALNIAIKPMRTGPDVVIAAQSEEFMRLVGDPGWIARVTVDYRERYGTDRVIVRAKQETRPLLEDLRDAGLLVTWSSAAAVTALLEGVPVMCAAECCVTYAGDDRQRWASVLADRQWTETEIASGDAWRALHGS